MNRATLYQDLGSVQQALADYTQAITLFSKQNATNNAYFRRGQMLAKMVRFEEALQDFDKALQIKECIS